MRRSEPEEATRRATDRCSRERFNDLPVAHTNDLHAANAQRLLGVPPVGEFGDDDLGVGRLMFEKVDDLTCGQFRLSCRGCGDVSREILASPQQLEPASNGWGKYVSLHTALISRALPHAHVPALSGHSQLGLVRRVRGDDVSALNEEIGIALELRHAVHLRDERPGGGAHDEQPDRRDQPGPGGTGRRSRSRSTRSPPPRTWPNFSACRTSWLGPRTASGILGMAERVVNVGSVLQLIVHPASS
jgi:hypothetical protein